mgnify:CR=1 FL=1
MALRGKLTKYNLGIKQAADIAMGDPALFVNDMMRLKPKRSGIGIVPHYSDKTHPIINNLKNIKNVKVIDVERCGSEVCHDIASCDFIVSSSLHGLVVADSFRIPNYRIKLFDNLKGGDFKFRDYASALKRKNIKVARLDFKTIKKFTFLNKEKGLEHVLAIAKAHFSFYFAIPNLIAKRQKISQKNSLVGKMNWSILVKNKMNGIEEPSKDSIEQVKTFFQVLSIITAKYVLFYHYHH